MTPSECPLPTGLLSEAIIGSQEDLHAFLKWMLLRVGPEVTTDTEVDEERAKLDAAKEIMPTRFGYVVSLFGQVTVIGVKRSSTNELNMVFIGGAVIGKGATNDMPYFTAACISHALFDIWIQAANPNSIVVKGTLRKNEELLCPESL